ncbi:MAG TPA: phospho-sugar mutase [Symbiobacteriaceae bacterium]
MSAISHYNLYQHWSQDPYFDLHTRNELQRLAGDDREIHDRFRKSLEFGTGGLRGIIGAGTNRINRYVVRHVTAGLADYISRFGPEAKARGVVIAYDCRHFSREFALEAALTLNAAGIAAYLWDSLRPTPMLSFAVRELKAMAGIVITASHNPPQYNGYKVYWEDGGQVPPERAEAIWACMAAISDLTTIEPMPEADARLLGLLRQVSPDVDRAYFDRLQPLQSTPINARKACRILYTPLHGTGNIPVRTALEAAGFQVGVVKAQELPDPDFATVRYPNPEEPDVYTLALQQAETEHPDVIMATDPDADRLGMLARDRAGGYRLLTGNQIGALLVDYLIQTRGKNGELPGNGAVIKTIATSNLIAPLCEEHGVALMDTHTGFKFIGDKIREFEETGSHTFLFGFEESYGYLGATFVRDKDAVMAALMAADATAHYKAQGLTLWDALERLWQRYGYFQEDLHSVTLPGAEGPAQVADLMDRLRRNPPAEFGGIPVAFTDDYATGTSVDHASGRTSVEHASGRTSVDHASGATRPLALGKADVLHYRFATGGFVMVRPSGTEPKLKLYFSVTGTDLADALACLGRVKADALGRMGLAR